MNKMILPVGHTINSHLALNLDHIHHSLEVDMNIMIKINIELNRYISDFIWVNIKSGKASDIITKPLVKHYSYIEAVENSVIPNRI
ncbi:MAG: hypothetical protein ACOC33_03800 [bacterium]